MAVHVIASILAIGLIVLIWYKFPAYIVEALDFNLSVIKWGCKFLPAQYGAMTESALRYALAADKAALFAEGTLAIKSALWLVHGSFVRVRCSKKMSGQLPGPKPKR